MNNHTVVGIFNTADEARTAVQQLKQAGFELDYIDEAHRQTANQGVGRTSDDSISSFFSSLFSGDDEEARTYTAAAQRGSSIVTVHVDSNEQATKASRILDDAGAVDINADNANNFTANQNYTNTDRSTAGDMQQTAKVIQEELQVGKRTEQTGGVRLRSRIVEKPVETSVRLREEHVTVERKPVDRPATEADFNAFKEGDITVTETAERAVVGKQARVVEEVSLGKNVTEREEQIHDTVRNTEVDVEKIPGNTTVDQRTAQNTDATNDQRRNS